MCAYVYIRDEPKKHVFLMSYFTQPALLVL